MNEIIPGSRVMVFDSILFKDDVSTPLSVTMRPATVICRYGTTSKHGRYPDLVDVRFDHRPERISYGHFTYGIDLIEEN